MLVENGDDSFEDNDNVNFMHENLDDLSFVGDVGWELIKLKDNSFLHATFPFQEISVKAIVKNKSFIFR